MNKEDLKQGEYYFKDTGLSDVVFIHNDITTESSIKANYYLQVIRSSNSYYFEKDVQLSCNNLRLATPEEKHWLNECIRLNKFITKQEAMKTFTKFKVGDWVGDSEWPETLAVKVTDIKHSRIYYDIILGRDKTITIYNSYNRITNTMSVIPNDIIQDHLPDEHPDKIVKEPEFVLPEKWVLHVDIANLELAKSFIHDHKNDYVGYRESWTITLDGIPTYLHYPQIPNSNAHSHFEIQKDYIEITTEQFKKYVLKQSDELIQPAKNASIEEILEYCKKKYPIGTKIKSNMGNICIINCNVSIDNFDKNIIICNDTIRQYDNRNGWSTIYYNGNYVEIVEETNQEPTREVTVKVDSLVYSLEDIKIALTKEYDKVDVEDILKVIKTIK